MLGRHLLRLRPAGGHAVLAHISGRGTWRLWLSLARGLPGLFLLTREEMRASAELAAGEPDGRARQALLLLSKHLEGARVDALDRIPGLRAIVLRVGRSDLVFRLSGAAPALSLIQGGTELARLGEGTPAWPAPSAAPETEWSRLPPAAVRQAAAGAAWGRREAQRLCPGLGPHLAAELVADPDGWAALVEQLRQPRPTLFTPRPLATCCDRDLASAADVVLVPFPLPSLQARGLVAASPGSWREAAALFLGARLRGHRFAERRQQALEGLRLETRRARQLEAHLVRDLGGLGSEDELRRQGEALLAFGGRVPTGSDSVVVPDPYDPGLSLRIGLDAKLSLHANADRLFDRGRRVVRARQQIESRLAATRVAAEALAARERALAEATDLDQLEAPRSRAGGRSGGSLDGRAPGARSYLTSRGLSLLVGRAARENHRLTFAVARPEDLWFHALGVPGAHVILRDNEGRAGAEDLREAAEVAAFFSEARNAGKVDVQAARRKHLRAARGSPGRVYVSHSDTLRVTPRDPEGRLRRR